MNAIADKFKKIGADVKVVYPATTRTIKTGGFRGTPKYFREIPVSVAPFTINIREDKGKEYFEIRMNPETKDDVEIQVLEAKPEERHLVLFVRMDNEYVEKNRFRGSDKITGAGKQKTVEREVFDKVTPPKSHYLCGHDERHWFVAAVDPCSTVSEAKSSLKPAIVREAEAKAKLSSKKSNKRHNDAWVRQGEWFFIPNPTLQVPDSHVREDEPIFRNVRGAGVSRGKPHTAQFAARAGGTPVKVLGAVILSIKEWEKLEPAKQAQYRNNVRDPVLYVRGTVTHDDHATIDLGSVWHRVIMNSERHDLRGRTVAFLD